MANWVVTWRYKPNTVEDNISQHIKDIQANSYF